MVARAASLWVEGMRTRDDTTSSGVVDQVSDALGRDGLSNQKATDGCKRGVVWGVRWNGNTSARGSPVLVVWWWCLTGKNQTSKINIAGKAWLERRGLDRRPPT